MRLDEITCFLLDMDGTFYLGDRILEGSLDFLNALAQKGKRAVFLTNNSSKSGNDYEKKLIKMGVPAPFLEVMTSGQAAGQYVLSRFAGQKGYLLGTSSLQEELTGMGLVFDREKPRYVLIGYDTTLDYEKMTQVCRWVRQGLPYIATHPDFNCPTENGDAPDIGAIIAFIKASTGREPDVIVGKPHGEILKEAVRRTGISRNQMAIVGDRLYTDIATGVNGGIMSILVLTGETSAENLQHSSIQPDMVFERLSAMIPYL